jgi:hypothetical protein
VEENYRNVLEEGVRKAPDEPRKEEEMVAELSAEIPRAISTEVVQRKESRSEGSFVTEIQTKTPIESADEAKRQALEGAMTALDVAKSALEQAQSALEMALLNYAKD